MSSTTYARILSKGIEAELPVIKNGMLRFTTDTGRLFLDTDNTRVEITDFVKDMNKADILSEVNPLPKIYLASDTSELLYYDFNNNEWKYVYIGEAGHSVNADTASYAINAATASVATSDGSGNNISNTYAPKNSPAFTGTPTVPDIAEGDESTKIANTNFVSTAIASAIAGVTQIDYKIVEELPASGVKGVIYLVPASQVSGDIYDEYIWLGSTYEKIGTTRIDLSNYVNTVTETGSGNAYTSFTKNGNTLTLTKGSTFLTGHPAVTHSSSTAAITPAAGSTFDVITNITTDNFGHASSFVKTNVKLPNSVTNATSATVANNGIKNITRSGNTFTVTREDNSTFTFNQKDDNTTYTTATTSAAGLLRQLNGSTSSYLRGDGTWGNPADNDSTYALTEGSVNGTVNFNNNGTTANVAVHGLGAMAYKGSVSKSDVDLGNVANINQSKAIKSITRNGLTFTATALDNSTFNFTQQDNNTTYDVATTAANGLLPKLGGGTTKYLRADGSWQVPPNTTYSNMTSASAGLAPAGGSGTTKYLRQDGSWQVPPNTTYTNGTGLSLSNGTFSINENASTVKYAKNAATATADGSGNTITSHYAPKASPAFTGTPTVPDVASGDTSEKIANTRFVATAIAAAISGVSGLSYEVVTSLPATGKSAVIYLVSNGSSTAQNIYDEYIWLGASYEKIGTTAMDLSNYVNTVSETGTGNAYTSFTKSGNTLTLTKGSTFLTSVPAQYATTATYTAANGISKSGTQFSNSGVRAVASGTANGTINVNTNGTTANVAVHGLGAMAYKGSVSKSDVGLGNVANYDQSKAIKSITRVGLTFTATAIDGSTFSFTQQDNNTTYGVATTASNGLLPKLGGGTTNYLRADGSWVKPPNDNTTYSNMTSASAGLAPAGGSGTTKYLRQDGSWQVPPNTTYSNMTSASAGLAPAGGSGTTKYLRQDGSWQVPPNTTYSNVTSATAGLAPAGGSGTTKYLRQDGTWVKPPNDNTTYTTATTSAAGLLRQLNGSTTTYLRGDGTWATVSSADYAGQAGAPSVEANFDFGELTSNGEIYSL